MTRWYLVRLWQFSWRLAVMYIVAVAIVVVAGINREWQLDITAALTVGVTISWFLCRRRPE